MKKHLVPVLLFFFITRQLCLAQTPILWGYTNQGGQHSLGTLLNYNITTGIETDKYDFGAQTFSGSSPYGVPIQANNGLLYGLAVGGTYSGGIIFSYNIATGRQTDLHNFSGYDGRDPYGSLIQASDGLLYGTTAMGGFEGEGTIFSYNITTGIETDLYDFGSTLNDGINPFCTLVQDSNGLLYGMTSNKGVYNHGNIFSYNITNGNYTDVYDFDNYTDGDDPHGALIQASNGLLYGMTLFGGVNAGSAGDGTIFSYNIATNNYTVLHDFGINTDGKKPYYGNLLQVTDSLLYGLTEFGGDNDTATNGDGIIFSYNIFSGNYNILHNFGSGYDGKHPFASLIKASNGFLYGMTSTGGTDSDGVIFNYNISNGTETNLYSFGSGTDGKIPEGSFIEIDDSLTVAPINPGICAGDSILLVANGVAAYTWSPASGLSATTGDSVIANPTITTTYTIVDNGGASTTVIVTVNPIPSITVTAPLSICNGTSTTLSASGATAYSWSPSEGLSSSADSIVTAAPTITTSYIVIGKNGDGCADTATTIVTVNPKPTLTVNVPAATCIGNKIILNASGANTYTWSPSTNLSASTGDSVIATILGSTTYTVIGTNKSCPNDTVQAIITAYPVPTIGINSPEPICNGTSTTLIANGTATYVWSPSINLSSSTDSIVTAAPTITTTYTVIGKNGDGCVDSLTTIIPVNSKPILIVPTPSTICNGGIAILTASGAYTYTWSPMTGLSATTGDSITASPTATTTYIVRGVNLDGCVDTMPVTVNVASTFVLGIDTPRPICSGNGDTLTVTGANTYTWSPSTGLNSTTGGTVIANPTITTTYTVTGTSLSGCFGTNKVTITVNPNPTITLNAPTSICNGERTKLTASGGVTYTWTPSIALSATTGDSVIANPSATIIYSVKVTSSAGCTSTALDTVKIIATPPIPISPQSPSVCPGQGVVLRVPLSGSDYLWSSSSTSNSTTGDSINVTPLITTTYIVTGIDSLGCSASDSDIVSISPAPNKPTIAQTGNTLSSSASDNNQWLRNDTLIADATNQTYIITQYGCYSVSVSNPANGCNTTSDTICVTPTGLNQLSIDNIQIVIYPNPSGGMFTIISSKTINKVNIFNVLGQLIYEAEPVQTQLNFELKTDGLYFISIISDNKAQTTKVVVSK